MPIGMNARAVGEHEERHFGPTRHSSMHDALAGAPNRRSIIDVDESPLRRRPILGDHDAFAGREAVGFEHDAESRTRRVRSRVERRRRPTRRSGSAPSARHGAP